MKGNKRTVASRVSAVLGAAAAAFDRLRQNKGLKKIGCGDLFIASIALAHRASPGHPQPAGFHLVPALKVENWAG
jgi:predicted nucleic acid-binding protein